MQALALKDAYEAEDDVDDAADDAEQAQHDREALAASVKPLQPKAPIQGIEVKFQCVIVLSVF